MATQSKRVSIPTAVRRAIIERDGGACVKCGRKSNLQLNHIKSVMNGGTNDPENLTTLCYTCHVEWHMVEDGSKVTYAQWLTLPSAIRLIIFFSNERLWPKNKSAAETRKALIEANKLASDMRRDDILWDSEEEDDEDEEVAS